MSWRKRTLAARWRPLVSLSICLGACPQRDVVQHGISFEKVRQGSSQVWLARVPISGEERVIPFYYLPDETSDVYVPDGLLEALRTAEPKPEMLYVSIDPRAAHYSYAAGAEIAQLVQEFDLVGGVPVKMAFSLANDRPEKLPVINCPQAVDGAWVVLVEQGPGNEVSRTGDCVHAHYHVPQDSMRVADRICYGLLGVF